MSVEEYLKPSVIHQIKRLDLRAQFVVKGFLHGLHASPFHGFSVQFSEHRKYVPGDDPKDLDWRVFARTDKYYIKKYEAETNINGYLLMDLSRSMDYTYRQELTKFDYAICLAAALAYLMISQQDPVGLITFSEQIRESLPPRSKRTQLNHLLTLLSRAKPTGRTAFAHSIELIAAMLKHRSLIMLFSDLLLDDPQELDALFRLTFAGHDVIVFHVLDEAELTFPFAGSHEFHDPESDRKLTTDAHQARAGYVRAIEQFRSELAQKCHRHRIDYVPLDTSMQFDKALMEYLIRRRARF
ncbi:MAG TPA: DUF58 domain-containing protein [Pirellulaceae bacterium]|nr:DUF58 domain-containing protein [Pirellulaceae bacterium]